MRQRTSGFVGRALKEAREARELTATSLADLIGVSRQAVSQYENGTQTPSPYVMRRLIEVLRFPYHFFLGLPTPDEKDLIFFRSVESDEGVEAPSPTALWLGTKRGPVPSGVSPSPKGPFPCMPVSR